MRRARKDKWKEMEERREGGEKRGKRDGRKKGR